MCRCYGRDKEKLKVEVRWEDAFLERSELGKRNSIVAKACHDKSLKGPFIVRYLAGAALLSVLPDIAPFPGATHKSANGMATAIASNPERCAS
jgi:hypothetical protein